MATARIFNFSAGPAILPPAVLDRAAEAVRELRGDAHAVDAEGIGLSLLEISHRSADFSRIVEQAFALCHEVLGIPADYELLLLQGGASQQFAMLPLNLRHADKAAAFVDTGVWSQKAIRESKLSQRTEVLATSSATNYDRIPELPSVSPQSHSYLHITTNNTIYGTEFAHIPEVPTGVRLVADMSSNIGSRPMALDRLAIGYAGAQKNLGPSGVTLVFIKREVLDAMAPSDDVPYFFRYATHTAKGSLYNTPNTFGVLVLKLMLEWLRDGGGVEAAAQRNGAKAQALYDCLDSSQLFVPLAQPGHRSQMNVSWTLGGLPEAERDAGTQAFLAAANEAGFVNLKGHRSVGGCRASIYNAFPVEGAIALAEFMREYERRA